MILLAAVLTAASGCDKNSPLPDISGSGGGGGEGNGDKMTLNILDFGADATGSADCSAAFDKLREQISTAGKRYIDVYLPAGKYRIAKRVVFDQKLFEGYDTNSGIVFRGAGEDVTELVCDNTEGGFYFNCNTNMITVTVENMSFVAPRAGAGTAIEFNTANQNAGDHHSRMLQVKNVLIRGEKYDKGHFTNGLLCYNAWYPYLDNVKITGRYGPDADKFKMNTGFLFQNCYSPMVTNSYFWNAATYGLHYKSVNGFLPEDGIVKDCYFVGQDYGIYIDVVQNTQAWPEPAFHLSNTHIHYKITGMHIAGMRQVFVNGNLFYCFNSNGSRWHNNGTTPENYESRDINCHHAWDVLITNNQFTEPATPKRIAVDISQYSKNVVVQGNIFNFDGTGIRNNSESACYSTYNIFGGEPDFCVGFVPYEDNTGKLVRVEYDNFKYN